MIRAGFTAAAPMASDLCSLASAAAAQPGDAYEQAPAYGLVDRIPAAAGGSDFSNVDAPHGKLYIARSDAVTVLDLATRKVTNKLAEAHRAHQVPPLPEGSDLLETDAKRGKAIPGSFVVLVLARAASSHG